MTSETQHTYDIRDALASYIDEAFANEAVFLERFCGNLGADELVECYMGNQRTQLVIRVPSGTQLTMTTSTAKFIAWCDEIRQPVVAVA